MKQYDVVVIGGGIFGVTAALELQQRGYATVLLDPGPLPHPLAASTDISKAVRMEYGADDHYMAMVEVCIPTWREWNEEFGETLYHETGVTMFTRNEMSPGGFEYESYNMLRRRGHAPERLGADEISRRFPAWRPGVHVDGFFHAIGGFAESGRVVEVLLEKASRAGVDVRGGEIVRQIDYEGNRVIGVQLGDGVKIGAGHVVVAAGTWTPGLVPELESMMRVTGHPVFHLRPSEESGFRIGEFATFMADIAQTGWYGFPVHPREHVVKVANHGIGRQLHPDEERVVTDVDEQNLRRFLSEVFPSLENAPLVYTRCCLYCDTLDEHFWIDGLREKSGLTIASGGSGHGFKFAPILGELIADAVEGKPNEWLPRFASRELSSDIVGEEAARHRG